MLVSTLRPARMAAMLAPAPRCATIRFRSPASRPSSRSACAPSVRLHNYVYHHSRHARARAQVRHDQVQVARIAPQQPLRLHTRYCVAAPP